MSSVCRYMSQLTAKQAVRLQQPLPDALLQAWHKAPWPLGSLCLQQSGLLAAAKRPLQDLVSGVKLWQAAGGGQAATAAASAAKAPQQRALCMPFKAASQLLQRLAAGQQPAQDSVVGVATAQPQLHPAVVSGLAAWAWHLEEGPTAALALLAAAALQGVALPQTPGGGVRDAAPPAAKAQQLAQAAEAREISFTGWVTAHIWLSLIWLSLLWHSTNAAARL